MWLGASRKLASKLIGEEITSLSDYVHVRAASANGANVGHETNIFGCNPLHAYSPQPTARKRSFDTINLVKNGVRVQTSRQWFCKIGLWTQEVHGDTLTLTQLCHYSSTYEWQRNAGGHPQTCNRNLRGIFLIVCLYGCMCSSLYNSTQNLVLLKKQVIIKKLSRNGVRGCSANAGLDNRSKVIQTRVIDYSLVSLIF